MIPEDTYAAMLKRAAPVENARMLSILRGQTVHPKDATAARLPKNRALSRSEALVERHAKERKRKARLVAVAVENGANTRAEIQQVLGLSKAATVGWASFATDAGLIEECGQAENGAVLYRVTDRAKIAPEHVAVVGQDAQISASMEARLAEVSAASGVSQEDILGDSIRPRIARARQCLMWILHKEDGLSLSEVGRFLNRDHSTVLFGVKRHQQRLDEVAS